MVTNIREIEIDDLQELLDLYKHLHEDEESVSAADAQTFAFYQAAGFSKQGKQAFVARPA